MLIVTLPDTLWTSHHGYWSKPHNALAYQRLMHLTPGEGLLYVLSLNGQERLSLEVVRSQDGCWEAGGVAKKRLDAGDQTLLDIFGNSPGVDLLNTALRAAETVPHSSIARSLGLFTRTVDHVVEVAWAAKRLTARVNVRARHTNFDQFMKKVEDAAGKRLHEKSIDVYTKFVAAWKEKVR